MYGTLHYHSLYTLGDSWSDLEYFTFPQTAHVIDSEVDSEVDSEMMAVSTLGTTEGRPMTTVAVSQRVNYKGDLLTNSLIYRSNTTACRY